MVQSWVDRINPQGLTTREPIRWDKIHAHSNTQVVSSKAKEAHSAKSERLRHEPENPTDFLVISFSTLIIETSTLTFIHHRSTSSYGLVAALRLMIV